MTEQTKNIIQAEAIHLQSINVISGAIGANPDIDPSVIKFYKLNFETETGINLEASITRFIFKVELIGIGEQDKVLDVNANYSIDFTFKIDDLSNFIMNKDDENNMFQLDNNLGATLMSIVYSTTRGIILSKTQGTIMNGVILPVVNPSNLLIPSQQKLSQQ